MTPFSPFEKASRYFTMADLTVTKQNASNIPNDEERESLKELGALLDLITDEIGPFTIASAYRSPEVNALVGGSETSLHSQGKAADLIPLTMSIENYFSVILNSPRLREMFGEIILKTPQGALHLSLPTWNKQGRAMIQERNPSTGQLEYRSMTSEEIGAYVDSEVAETVVADASSVESRPYKIAGAVVAFSASLLLLVYLKRARA